MSSTPARLLFLRPDTYGDLVLFQPVLALVRQAFPEMAIAVLIREPYLDITPMIGGDSFRWLTTACDPFRQGPRDNRAAFEALRETVRAFLPDCVVAACFERTWLEAAVASFLPETRQICLGTREFSPLIRATLEVHGKIEWSALFPEKIKVEADLADWEKNLRLADFLKLRLAAPALLSSQANTPRSLSQVAKNLGLETASLTAAKGRKQWTRSEREIPRWWPHLSVPNSASERARQILTDIGITTSPAICCPAGSANVQIKSWPPGYFGDTVAWLECEHGIRSFLMGHESEEATLELVRESARAAGANPAMWLGHDGEIATMAALLAEARFYLGNDTGALHMAAALGRPAVSIFGGGTWPRFKPLARRSAVVVQPLPCFGCGWNCLFGYAPCVREIPVAAVRSALDWLLTAEKNDETEIQVLDALPENALALISGAVAVHGWSRDDDDASVRPTELAQLLQKLDFAETDRAARLETIERQSAEIVKLQAEVDRWLKEAGQLWPQLNEAKNTSDRLAGEMADLRVHFAASEADRAARQRVIDQQAAESVRLQKETERWLGEAQKLWPQLNAAQNARNLLAAQLEDLQQHFEKSEADRAARLAVIEQQGAENIRFAVQVKDLGKNAAELNAENAHLRGRLDYLESHRMTKLLKKLHLWPK